MRWLMMAASLRQASFNKALIRATADLAQQIPEPPEVDLVNFNEVHAPSFNGDEQDTIPPNVEIFKKRLDQADALVLSSPEYNYSMPGSFKNLYDWVSVYRPMPWRGLPVLLMCATVSETGGRLGIQALRGPFIGCGAYVFPSSFILCSSYQAFDEQGALKDENLRGRLTTTLSAFHQFAKQFKE